MKHESTPRAMADVSVRLRTGMHLFSQQFGALFKKNALLAQRKKGSTIAQLFGSFMLVFLLFCFVKVNDIIHDKDSKAGLSLSIPPCEDKAHIKKPCFDFVWSGKGNPTIKSIVTGIMNNNPGRQIPIKKVCIRM